MFHLSSKRLHFSLTGGESQVFILGRVIIKAVLTTVVRVDGQSLEFLRPSVNTWDSPPSVRTEEASWIRGEISSRSTAEYLQPGPVVLDSTFLG